MRLQTGFCNLFWGSKKGKHFEVMIWEFKTPSCGLRAGSVVLQVIPALGVQPPAVRNRFRISSSVQYSNPLHSIPPNCSSYRVHFLSLVSTGPSWTFNLLWNLSLLPPGPPPLCRLHQNTSNTVNEHTLFTCLSPLTVLRAEALRLSCSYCSHFDFSFYHSTLHIIGAQCF